MPGLVPTRTGEDKQFHDCAELVVAACLPDNGDLGIFQGAFARRICAAAVIKRGHVPIEYTLAHCPMHEGAKGGPCMARGAVAALLRDLLIERSHIILRDALYRAMFERLAMILKVSLHLGVTAGPHRFFAGLYRMQLFIEVFLNEFAELMLVLSLGLPTEIDRIFALSHVARGDLCFYLGLLRADLHGITDLVLVRASTGDQPELIQPRLATAAINADAEAADLVIEVDLAVGLVGREHQFSDFVVGEIHG